jgi:hypothetical protein
MLQIQSTMAQAGVDPGFFFIYKGFMKIPGRVWYFTIPQGWAVISQNFTVIFTNIQRHPHTLNNPAPVSYV